jgi:large-conductance mechanosensitive channel
LEKIYNVISDVITIIVATGAILFIIIACITPIKSEISQKEEKNNKPNNYKLKENIAP